MTEEALHKKKEERFFFNMNIFDEDHVEEEEEEIPPPPTFSEEELATAKKEAFEQGRQEGHDTATKAARESQTKRIADALEKIATDTAVLFQQEQQRAELYEREAVALALKTFERLFPFYQEKFGFDELKETMSNILQKQQNHRKIAVHVKPDNVAGVEKLLTELTTKGLKGEFSVQGDETLDEGTCRMEWDDGGATRDPDALAEEIQSLMQQVLAGTDTKGHDRDDDGKEPQTESADPVPQERPGGEESAELQTPDAAPDADIVEKPDE